MGRLIDAEKVYELGHRTPFHIGIADLYDLMELLADVPTVDAVEVVRCEKCNHAVWDEEYEMWKCVKSAEYDEESGVWFGFCEYHNGDFFCADGERKGGDGNG